MSEPTVKFAKNFEQVRIELNKVEYTKVKLLRTIAGINISQFLRNAIHKEYARQYEFIKKEAPSDRALADPNQIEEHD